ncbi:MAG: hypothetical protein H7259_07650 [Cytophagales bacterium]|nr:hypothetical protein [Cytophaga sp.]
MKPSSKQTSHTQETMTDIDRESWVPERMNDIEADVQTLTLKDFLPESLKIMLEEALKNDENIPDSEDIEEEDDVDWGDEEKDKEEKYKAPEEDEGTFGARKQDLGKDGKPKPNVDSEASNGNESDGWLNKEFTPERMRDKNK